MGKEYPKINLLNCYIGLASDFNGKEGFTIYRIKHGLCVIEKYPDGFTSTYKVLQVHLNMTYHDERVKLINCGKLEGDLDTEDGIREPLSKGVQAFWGIIVPPEDSMFSWVSLGLYDYSEREMNKNISL